MNMEFERQLTIPMEVKKMYPLEDDLRAIVEDREKQLQDIFAGKDDRIVLIIGPCSADREDSVIDYISRLRKVQDKVERTLRLPVQSRMSMNTSRNLTRRYARSSLKGPKYLLRYWVSMVNL